MSDDDTERSPARIRAGLRAHESDRARQVVPERFTFVDVLGEGGSGQVLEVEDTSLGRRVALKRLSPNGGPGLIEQLERLRIEAEAAARLQHPGIVAVHEFVQDGATAFIVQELVRGGSLQDRLDTQGPLTAREAAALGRDLARALAAAHAEGVLHRDLKPSNVLLEDGELRPRIADFGLAKLVDGPAALTSQGRVMGTPTFMSPEQAEGDRDRIGPRTDVFLLGATLYAALSGRAPFEATSLVGVLAAVRRCRPPALDPVRYEDPDLAAVVARCMARDPAGRYETAEQVAADLERYLAGDRVSARPRRFGIAAALLLGIVGSATAVVLRPTPATPAPTVAASSPSLTPTGDPAPTPNPPAPGTPTRIVELGIRHGGTRGAWVAAAWFDAARFILVSSDGRARRYALRERRIAAETPWIGLPSVRRTRAWEEGRSGPQITLAHRPLRLTELAHGRLVVGGPSLTLGWYEAESRQLALVRSSTQFPFAAVRRGSVLHYRVHPNVLHTADLGKPAAPTRTLELPNVPSVVDLALTPKGDLVALCHDDVVGRLLVFRPGPDGLDLLRERETMATVECVAVAPSGRELVVGTDLSTLHVYDAETLAMKETLSRHASLLERSGEVNRGTVQDVTFLAEGRRLLSLSHSSSARRRNDLVLWDYPARKPIARLSFAPGVMTIALAPDERHAVLASNSGRLELVRFE